ncbi:MAG: HDIG domain-containing protein [Capnocytophaga sp.]|nr:HDIG domain-containing protein [Capnocytophaga sp.]
MRDFWHNLYRKQPLLYKIFLCIVTTFIIVSLFPKKSNFGYKLQEGQLWLYPTLYAPFDFSIKKIDFSENTSLKNSDTIQETEVIIHKGEVIIHNQDFVNKEKLFILNALKDSYKLHSQDINPSLILFGYFILVGISILVIVLYLYHFETETYKNNTTITLIFCTILLIISIIHIILKENGFFLYAIPVCILPLILKAFFDLRLGIFVHFITIIIIGFMVPNPFEFIFISTMAGGVLLLNIKGLHHRINLFLSIGYAITTYIVSYLSYMLISKGNLEGINYNILGLFFLNGILTLFTLPLTYFYEKIFGLVSNVSLLELSDTNSKLLRELSEKAAGSFHHSLQVANLAEAAAAEIGANTMLVRVGALYHDIGKIKRPLFFTENQKTFVNPHDELSPLESAKIIKGHVIDGIEIARQNNIPDRIIDFIRTHHGNSLIYYFYKKQLDSGEPFKEEDFRYSGPLPYSKETAILMMCDSVEAASKSLVNPDTESINALVENIIKKQIEEKQFLNSDITFKDIEKIKKVLKNKLSNIYHLRISYPK